MDVSLCRGERRRSPDRSGRARRGVRRAPAWWRVAGHLGVRAAPSRTRRRHSRDLPDAGGDGGGPQRDPGRDAPGQARARRRLPAVARDRPWGHGDRVRSRAGDPRPARRPQGAADERDPGSALPRALPHRGPGCGASAAPAHRAGHRLRPARGRALLHDAVHRWPWPRRGARRRPQRDLGGRTVRFHRGQHAGATALARGRDRRRIVDGRDDGDTGDVAWRRSACRRPGLLRQRRPARPPRCRGPRPCARQRRAAPRHEAIEPPARRSGSPVDHRLRALQAGGGRRRPHANRGCLGDLPLHGARTLPGRRRRPQRRLRPRHHALRARDPSPGIRRGEPRPARREGGERAAAPAAQPRPPHPGRSRDDRAQGDGTRSCAALPHGGGLRGRLARVPRASADRSTRPDRGLPPQGRHGAAQGAHRHARRCRPRPAHAHGLVRAEPPGQGVAGPLPAVRRRDCGGGERAAGGGHHRRGAHPRRDAARAPQLGMAPHARAAWTTA